MTGGVEKYCRCGDARWTKCAHPWYMKKFRHHGREEAPCVTKYARVVLTKTITTKTEADEVAEQIRTAIRAGTYVSAKAYRPAPVVTVPTPGGSLDSIAELFALDRIDNGVSQRTGAPKKKNSKTNDRAILKKLCAMKVARGRLGALPMESVTLEDLADWRRSMPLSNSSWNKHRTVLGQLFGWAKWQKHLAVDPIAAAPRDALAALKRGKCRQRKRPISTEEWDHLLDAARGIRRQDHASRLYAVLVALMETALRIGELLALQWRDIDWDARVFRVQGLEDGAGKTGDRQIELSKPMVALLRTLQQDPAGQRHRRTAYVFGDPYGARIKSIDKAFNTCVLRSYNIEPRWTQKGAFDRRSRVALDDIDLNIHDIRHEAAQRLLNSKIFDLSGVQKRLGHTNIATTSIYLDAPSLAMRRSQDEYDAWREQQQAVPAAAGEKRRRSGGKAGENTKHGDATGEGPRLVKGRKIR